MTSRRPNNLREVEGIAGENPSVRKGTQEYEFGCNLRGGNIALLEASEADRDTQSTEDGSSTIREEKSINISNFETFVHIPNVSIGIGQVELLEWDNAKGGCCTKRELDIVDGARVLSAERWDDETGLGEGVRKGGEDGTIESGRSGDGVEGEFDGERVLD